jgi:NAD-dependent DNA ligase
LSESGLTDIIQYANTMYYNQTPVFTDNEYDIIKEFIEKKYPKNEVVLEVGAPVTRNKVTLPYEMPSMDKIKPDTNALNSWTAKYNGPYVLSCKLDGVSALYTTEGLVPKLYTRGNGKIGQDISHLIPFLKLPKKNQNQTEFTIRGELLILKSDFNAFLKDTFANARNLVSGLVNQKQVDNNIKYVHFVAYEVIHPEMKPSEQMRTLKQLGVETVLYKSVDSLSNEMLSELLITWRKEYVYEIDGIIVTDDKVYPRKSGNPDHAFAFKMVLSDQIAEAKVVDVIWTPSKNGLLKPRVRIEPVALGGVTIEYATGFNGKFIEDNKIGIGAVIQIIRSGDVIPYIKGVTVPAENPKMPDAAYVWTDTHVDIVLENYSDDITVREKNTTGFFVSLQVDGLSSGNVHRIFEAGFDSVPKILKMSKADFTKVDGFKEKMINY